MSQTRQLEVTSSRGDHAWSVAPRERQLRLSELLRHKHLPLNTRCGQRGLCDGCVVELLRGQLIHLTSGRRVNGNNQPQSLRGCEYRLGDEPVVQLRIPPRSQLAYEPQVVSDFKINVPRAHDPLWQQIAVPGAEIHDGADFPAALCAAIARRTKRRRPIRADATVINATHPPGASLLATLEYREDHWLITHIASAPEHQPLGVAIDIGTTTVALLLVNLLTGQVVATAANFNKQIHLGDDVLTRINLCSTDPAMTAKLQELIVHETIKPLLAGALQQAGASEKQLRCLVVAGNTTMLHLFAGIDPSSMGIAPFTPSFLQHRVLSTADVPLTDPKSLFNIHLLPGAAAYVGADLTAGTLATGLVYDDGPSLLVDVGTNGEIILKHGEHLFGCATAAGPAFEGAGLTSGVRATDGAISHLTLSTAPLQVKTEVIGQHTPIGLCGTAYIDFLAQARRIGSISATGRFDTTQVADGSMRVANNVFITESDIARLLQAKAAVAAGILTLLERRGLTPAQIKTVYLAGGFGLHLAKQHTIDCGLLPGFRSEQIEVVGNTSLAGAYLSLLDCGALDEIGRVGHKLEVVELNLDPGFEDRYIDQLSLPTRDASTSSA